jgi:hypothetical protein
VVHPCDETSLRGAVDAAEAGIIKPVLVGPAAKIANVASQFDLNIARYEVVDAPHSDIRMPGGSGLELQRRGEQASAGIVLGARVPIVLTSRADSVRARIASCAVAVLYGRAPGKSGRQQAGPSKIRKQTKIGGCPGRPTAKDARPSRETRNRHR